MSWQPIETAPRDGTRVLICVPEEEVQIGWFVDTETREYGEVVRSSRRWAFASSMYSMHLSKVGEPTHWMPLPDPPVGFV